MRDVVRGNLERSSLKGEFYAEVAMIWGLILSLYLMQAGAQLTAAALVKAVALTMSGAVITRMLAYGLGWKGPRYAWRRGRPSGDTS